MVKRLLSPLSDVESSHLQLLLLFLVLVAVGIIYNRGMPKKRKVSQVEEGDLGSSSSYSSSSSTTTATGRRGGRVSAEEEEEEEGGRFGVGIKGGGSAVFHESRMAALKSGLWRGEKDSYSLLNGEGDSGDEQITREEEDEDE